LLEIFFDLWLMRGGVRWKEEYNDLLQYFLEQARKGIKVVYIPGNHDEGVRVFTPLSLGNIQIVQDTVHTTLSGEDILVIHGDEADSIIKIHPNMAKFGAFAYDLLIELNIQVNRLLSLFRLRHFSFSEYVKHKVKDAVKYINHFEEVVVDIAIMRGCRTVVAGHIHTTADKTINGVRYLNCGDWISNCAAVVETLDGTIKLVIL
jgi:UDP-2,3-diacylglucosamine pyrophosphatase LpxH